MIGLTNLPWQVTDAARAGLAALRSHGQDGERHDEDIAQRLHAPTPLFKGLVRADLGAEVEQAMDRRGEAQRGTRAEALSGQAARGAEPAHRPRRLAQSAIQTSRMILSTRRLGRSLRVAMDASGCSCRRLLTWRRSHQRDFAELSSRRTGSPPRACGGCRSGRRACRPGRNRAGAGGVSSHRRASRRQRRSWP